MDWGSLALILTAVGGLLSGAVALVVAYLNHRSADADDELEARAMNFSELVGLYQAVKAERDEYKARCKQLEDEARSWRA